MSSTNVHNSNNNNQNEENSNADQESTTHVGSSNQSSVASTDSKKLRYKLRIPPPLKHSDASNATIEINESFIEDKMMIDLTVKTLDSQNHPFHVEEDITIRQFKEKISDSLNIPPDSQRLIFCGRVLQDDKKLSEYALVSGNAVHLVQRPPPSQAGSGGSHSTSTGTGTGAGGSRSGNGIRRSHTFRMRPSNTDRNGVYLGSMPYPDDLGDAQGNGRLSRASSWLCASRLNLARRMLRRAGALLTALEDPRAASPPRDIPSPPATVHVTQAVEVLEVGIAHVGDVAHVGVPNITIFREASDPTVTDEGIINIGGPQQMDSQDTPADGGPPVDIAASSEQQSETLNSGSNDTGSSENLQPGHSSESLSSTDSLGSTDTFTLASEIPVGGATQESTTSNAEPATTNDTNTNSNRSQNNARPNTPLAPLAAVLDELNDVQNRLQPFLAQYHQILRNDPTYPDHESAANAQRMFNRVSQILHFLSHAYHIISDLMVDLHQTTPRFLTCRPVLMQRSVVGRAGMPTIVTENFVNEVPNITVQMSTNRQASSETSGNNTASANNSTETNNVRPGSEPTSQGGNEFSTPQSQNFEFMLPDGITMGGNVEVVMEVSPRFGRPMNTSTNATSASSTATSAINNNSAGITIPLQDQSTGVISQIMQAVAGQIMNQMRGSTSVNAINVSSSSGPVASSASNAAQPNNNTAQQTAGQNSQARVNTATHPTTSTQTRSTARPHVQLRQGGGLRLPFGGIWGGMTNNFDPYLPCNSHHLRPRNQNNNNNNTTNNDNNNTTTSTGNNETVNNGTTVSSTQNDSVHAAVSAAAHTMASSMASAAAAAAVNGASVDILRDVLASQSVIDTLHNAVIQVIDGQDSGNMIIDFIMEVVHRTPLNELFTMLSGGDASPLNELRLVIRRFLVSHLAPGQENLGQEELRAAGNRAVNWIRNHLNSVNSISTRDDIDLVATLCSIVRARLPDLLAVAMDQDAGAGAGESDYGRRLTSQLRQFVDLMVAAVMHCCQDGQQGAEQVFQRFVASVAQGADPNLLMLAMSYSVAEYRNYMNTVTVNPDVIQPYIVYKNQESAISQSLMEVEEIDTSQQRSSGLLSQPSSSSSYTQLSPVNAKTEVCGHSQGSRNDCATDCRDSNQTRQVPSLPDIEMDDDSAEPVAAEVVIGSQPWHNSLPTDWVPIISRDVIRQRRQSTQSPLSDAYLQGMPSKRRKLITSERPPLNLSQSLQDTMRHTLQATPNQPPASVPINEIVTQSTEDSALLEAYRQQIRSCIRARLQQDPDFNPALYPNSQQKFK